MSTLAFGQVPNTFSSGETISSSKINANFSFLASAIKNDNVTAMMVCNFSGISGGKFYYSGCYSTDDQVFETVTISTQAISKMQNSDSTFTLYKQNSTNSISLKNLFDNKWILYDSKIKMGSICEGNSCSYSRLVHYQNHIFYKISSN